MLLTFLSALFEVIISRIWPLACRFLALLASTFLSLIKQFLLYFLFPLQRYGDIVAVTNAGQVMTIILMLVGKFVLGCVFVLLSLFNSFLSVY